jgi:hypothetical protein
MTDGLNCGTVWLYIYPEEIVWFKSLQSHVEIILYPTKPDAGFHCSKDYFLYARLNTHKGVGSWGLSVLNPSQHEINIDKWYLRISSTSHKPQFLLMTIKKIFKPEWAGLIIHAATFYIFGSQSKQKQPSWATSVTLISHYRVFIFRRSVSSG